MTIVPCACKKQSESPANIVEKADTSNSEQVRSSAAVVASQKEKLPRLLDLGAHQCIPCKKMAPILDELKKEYAGVFETEFIDVWQDANAGTAYGIDSIPTQIFFDADGEELFLNVGYISIEDILAKWKELGVAVEQK